MFCCWLKTSPSLEKGIQVINQLDEIKFEQFLKRIALKLRLQDLEIFTSDEKKKLQVIFKIDEETLLLVTKTILYIYKRLLKFIILPVNVKKDLTDIGFVNEKTEAIVKIWSLEISSTLNELATKKIDKNGDILKLSWKLNTELSSEYHKKCKVPKTYLLITDSKNETEVELTHSDLYSVFIQLESVQNELDNIL